MILAGFKIFPQALSPFSSVPNNAVVTDRGMIKAVGPLPNIKKLYPGHSVTFLQNAVLLPGLVNAHTHLELPHLLHGIRAGNFPQWIINLICAKKNLTFEDYAAAALENIRILIRVGTTTVGEICTHDASPLLLKQYGLRAVVFKELIAMGTQISSLIAGKFIPAGRETVLVKNGISPHSPYTVSASALKTLAVLSRDRSLRLAMHVAESRDEIQLLQRRKSGLAELYRFVHWELEWAPKGMSSFEYLEKIGLLSPRLLAVHAVQASDREIRIVRQAKVAIAHCPRSNNELGVGRMPLKKMLDAGITVGLGTDSLASVSTLNMWDEMRYAFKIHRKDGVTPEDIFSIATIGGAKALGLDTEIGTLEPGKKADIIAVPLPKKNTGNLYYDLLRETKSSIMTMVNGKILHLKR